jgi:hypothetical protein
MIVPLKAVMINVVVIVIPAEKMGVASCSNIDVSASNLLFLKHILILDVSCSILTSYRRTDYFTRNCNCTGNI